MILSREDYIARWLKNRDIKGYTIDNGIVNVPQGDVILAGKGTTYIPFKFGIVGGRFDCHESKLISLENFPSSAKEIDVSKSHIKSLSGIEKVVQSVEFFCIDSVVIRVLGLLLIRDIACVGISHHYDEHYEATGKIRLILNNHLDTRDILSAQDELLDAGFKDQARL